MIGSKTEQVIRIEDICFYETSSAGIHIYSVDGSILNCTQGKMLLAKTRETVLNAIEARRIYIFQTRGMALPPLTKERRANVPEQKASTAEIVFNPIGAAMSYNREPAFPNPTGFGSTPN